MPRTRSARPCRNAAWSGASHRRCAMNSASSRAWVGGYIGPMMTISGFMPRLPGSAAGGGTRPARLLDHQPMDRGFLERLGRLDLDAEAGEPDIAARPGGIKPDRGDAEIAQDLGAEPDILPLPAAFQFGAGAVLGDRRGRHAGGAVAQIDEDAAPGLLEAAQRQVDGLGAAEHVLDHIAAMQPGRHVLAVADLAVDEGIVVHLVERRHIGIAVELAGLGLDLELCDPGDELLA